MHIIFNKMDYFRFVTVISTKYYCSLNQFVINGGTMIHVYHLQSIYIENFKARGKVLSVSPTSELSRLLAGVSQQIQGVPSVGVHRRETNKLKNGFSFLFCLCFHRELSLVTSKPPLYNAIQFNLHFHF